MEDEPRNEANDVHRTISFTPKLLQTSGTLNSPVLQYERPRAVTLASSACVDKTTKIITEFTGKDPFLHLKQTN